jgi:phosphotransferase family enzyme
MHKLSLSERSLNLLLRRVDWRFLLPNPNPKNTLCLTEGQLADAVEYISESVTYSDSNPVGHDYDLAVAVNPDQRTLDTAVSALKPGGSCYIEWDLKFHNNVNTIKSRLEHSGLNNIDIYFPNPSPDLSLSAIWIPIESSGAINYFILKSLSDKRKSVLKTIGKILRWSIWSLIPNLFKEHPIFLIPGYRDYKLCTTAFKPKSADNKCKYNAADNDLLQTASLRVKESGMTKEPENTHTLMLTGGRHSSNKIIIIVFSEHDFEPSFMIKMPRIPDSAPVLAEEANNLRILQKQCGDLKGIPKLLFSDKDSGVLRVAETYLRGSTLDVILCKKNYRGLALKTTDFLVSLAMKTKSEVTDKSQKSPVEQIKSDFISTFGSILDPDLIRQTQEVITDSELTHHVYWHRDLAPWNVILDKKGNLGVLDWEASMIRGLPAADLIYFLTYLSVYLEDAHDPDKFLECYRRMLDDTTYTGTVLNECLTHYCTKVGIPLSVAPTLRLLTWLDVINWKYYELNHFEDKPPTPEALRNILHISLWEEELKQRKL